MSKWSRIHLDECVWTPPGNAKSFLEHASKRTMFAEETVSALPKCILFLPLWWGSNIGSNSTSGTIKGSILYATGSNYKNKDFNTLYGMYLHISGKQSSFFPLFEGLWTTCHLPKVNNCSRPTTIEMACSLWRSRPSHHLPNSNLFFLREKIEDTWYLLGLPE